jgi:alcohol dehydrogenase (NADP+)
MGAKEFIVTGEKDWHKPYAFTFDFILNCADATHKFNLKDYFGTMKGRPCRSPHLLSILLTILIVMGRFHNVGLGDHPLPEMMAQDFAGNGCYIGASHIGNRPEMLAMFDLASKQNIKSWITKIPISEEGCKKAVTAVKENDGVRYRLVLTDYDAAFGKRD